MWEFIPAQLSGWNSQYEAEIGFKLPDYSFYGEKLPIKRSTSSAVHLLHASERLEIFRNIEGLMDL
jgi:hypothetical protein